MSTMSLPRSQGGAFHTVRVIASKEITDALRNRIFIMALAMLLGLTLIAITLGSLTVHNRVSEYEQSAQVLRDIGRTEIPPMPSLNPIAISKTFVNYLAMVGALLAMILGYMAIDKERKGGTLPLILSRPVYRDQLLAGKLLGNAMLLAALLLAVGVVTTLAIGLVGGVWLTLDQIIRLGLTMVMSWLYMLIFFLLALLMALLLPNGHQALLVTIIVWLIFAFIFPQVGDTMDLDNQLPGGFFAALGIRADQKDEEEALQNFRWYENVREGVEQLSPTKHYERISFALLGVNLQFVNTAWTDVISLKLVDVVGLVVPVIVLLAASYAVFLRQE
jgi:ABC-2 type transport system permease protein